MTVQIVQNEWKSKRTQLTQFSWAGGLNSLLSTTFWFEAVLPLKWAQNTNILITLQLIISCLISSSKSCPKSSRLVWQMPSLVVNRSTMTESSLHNKKPWEPPPSPSQPSHLTSPSDIKHRSERPGQCSLASSNISLQSISYFYQARSVFGIEDNWPVEITIVTNSILWARVFLNLGYLS